MIRYYCQYSFGGFRTFRIYGHDNENLVDQEIDKIKSLDFPPQCSIYFNYGGAKMLMRTLYDGQVAIVLRDIPGIEKDTDGRTINCALQIVGDADDMPLMRNALLAIVNDVPKFQANFTDGFSMRGGLHYDGRFLADFIKGLEGITLSAPNTILDNLDERKGPVYVFVPTSPLFGNDSNLTKKVIKELQLASSEEEIAEVLKNTIQESALKGLAGHIVATQKSDTDDKNTDEDTAYTKTVQPEQPAETATPDIPQNDMEKKNTDDGKGNEAALSLRVIDLERDLEKSQKEKAEIEAERDELKQRIEELLKAKLRSHNTILGLIIGASVVTTALIITLILK